MAELVKLLIFASVSVAFLFIISKILGKKQIAQLEFIDYVMGISIGSIAAEMATDVSETPFYYYLISMTIFFLFDLLITFLGRKGTFFKHFFKGKPITVIYEGKIDYKQLKKSKLDTNDLLGMCRNKGYFDVNDIAYAVLENSGDLSVLPRGNEKPVVICDITQDFEQAELPTYLVIDGKISFSSLSNLQKDVKWLFDSLKITDKKELKNFILVSYDEKTQQFSVHKKDE